ncbi:MAG: DUF6614 family protein [Pseudomonadota bacterium]
MLLGFFDLKDGVEEADFHAAYAAFGDHMIDQGLATGWASARRAPDAGYDVEPPKQSLMMEIRFASPEQARAAWDYVEANQPPLRQLHSAVLAKVANAHFALYDVKGEDRA